MFTTENAIASRRVRTLVLVIAACGPAILHGQTSDVLTLKRTSDLVAVLQSDSASEFEKAKACQRLAVVGEPSAVPALAKLLTDPHLSNYARHALEGIATPECTTALRDAADRLDGALLIGVLDSIGRSRDGQSLDLLTRLLTNEDAAVAEAAARALGNVGDARAAQRLRSALEQADTDRRPALAKACLIAGQRLLQDGHSSEAIGIFDVVRNADVPRHLRLAATYDAMLARGKKDTALLIEQFDSDDEGRFRLALQAARQIGADVTAEFTAGFAKLPEQRQALVVLALGDLGDSEAIPTLVNAAEKAAPQVRVAALHVLGKRSDASTLPTMIDAAMQDDPDVAEAALASLTAFQGQAADEAVVRMLGSDDDKRIALGIDLASRRRTAEAGPRLLELAEDAEPSVRVASIAALGSTIAPEDFSRLLAKATKGNVQAEQAAAREAARVACFRLPQKSCAIALGQALNDAPPESQTFLIEQLAVVGGDQALAAIVRSAKSQDDVLQDAATRVLGEWLSADAAPALYDLARTLTDGRYKTRALRGYIRLARQLDMPMDQRMEVCRNTLSIARRADEQTLVLDVLRQYPSPEGLRLSALLIDEPQMKEAACGAAVAIAERLVLTAPVDIESVMQKVSQATANPTVAARAKNLALSARQQP